MIHFLPSIVWRLPEGYGGLYAQAARSIVSNGFRLPRSIPYYGPGGIPFAYPPIGLYAMAVATGWLHVSPLDYLRVAPAVASLAANLVFVGLARRLLHSWPKALIAGVLLPTLSEPFWLHDTAAGVVRAPALALALGTIWAWLEAERHARPKLNYTALTGLLLGLTVMTHLSYAVFTILGLASLVLVAPERKKGRILRSAGVIVLGAIVSAPWWSMVISRYGLQTLLWAAGSHGNAALFVSSISGGQLFTTVLTPLVWTALKWRPLALALLSLLGLISYITRRRWLLPLWSLASLLMIGEPARFVIILGLLMGTDILVNLATIRPNFRRRVAQVASPVQTMAAGMLLASLWLTGAVQASRLVPALSSEEVEIGSWMRKNTPPDSIYLLASDIHDQAEWLPYLAQREPSLGHWGAEWKGSYPQEINRFFGLRDCVASQQIGCFERAAVEAGRSPDFVLVPAEDTLLNRQALSEIGLTFRFGNAGFNVYSVGGSVTKDGPAHADNLEADRIGASGPVQATTAGFTTEDSARRVTVDCPDSDTSRPVGVSNWPALRNLAQ